MPKRFVLFFALLAGAAQAAPQISLQGFTDPRPLLGRPSAIAEIKTVSIGDTWEAPFKAAAIKVSGRANWYGADQEYAIHLEKLTASNADLTSQSGVYEARLSLIPINRHRDKDHKLSSEILFDFPSPIDGSAALGGIPIPLDFAYTLKAVEFAGADGKRIKNPAKLTWNFQLTGKPGNFNPSKYDPIWTFSIEFDKNSGWKASPVGMITK